MSHYSKLATRFVDQGALIEALVDTGIRREAVQVHEVPVQLEGYRGDRRSQRAHVVIPRSVIGVASNDIGFERTEDGSFRLWVSDFDRKHFGKQWTDRLTRRYAYHATIGALSAQGFATVDETVDEDGSLRLVLRRVR